ncbi:MAG TPA: hypothetical protein VF758_05940 [Candidatus Acidoferrum sp.]
MMRTAPATETESQKQLSDGSRIGVIGGGPAGSFFAFFLLQLADRVGMRLHVDIYEPRNFEGVGPKSCNMCGGIVSESLVENLATEGIHLPSAVIQRSLDSYHLHTDVGDVHIATPEKEKRIAAVHRGCGPRDMKDVSISSFDGYLLQKALSAGARHVRARVTTIGKRQDRPYLQTDSLQEEEYDLLALATGINAPAVKVLDDAVHGYAAPGNTKTYICEACLYGRSMVKRYLGSSMHVFLLDIPQLEFAAVIPKGEYATVCLLGTNIDNALVRSFLDSSEVTSCFPPGWQQNKDYCHCSPRINVRAARTPYADRIVFIGDCGATRLYKDGIGAAYRTAKAAAATAVFHGVAADDFRRHYQPACDTISRDNQIGQLVFTVTRTIQKHKFLRRGLCRMVAEEQKRGGSSQRMSSILWNTFTGSAPYRDIFLKSLHPAFLLSFLQSIITANLLAWNSHHPRRD